MTLDEITRLSSFLSRDYAGDILRLLVAYQSVSSSEAASRLGLHIRTVQDFLEGLVEAGVVEKKEVTEGKRPYFRYHLINLSLNINLDLTKLGENAATNDQLSLRIREKKESGARFTTSRTGGSFSNVAIWTGTRREGKERKISLTRSQGIFLFNLPLPGGNAKSVSEIIKIAGIESSFEAEILDIVSLLIEYGVIEKVLNT